MIDASESYFDLMRSAPHWGFELTLEALSGLVMYPAIRWLHRKWECRMHREIDAEHGVVHVEEPDLKEVRVVVMAEATYDRLMAKMDRDVVREAERYIR